jgi:DNA-binding response OmpR family regulator
MTGPKNKRVLLVEDNEKILRGNKRMLEWEGYEVGEAMTLREARAQLEKNCPDVIVLDIMLPDGSGLDFMRQLRESNHGGVPILLLTGLTTQEDILRGLKSGGDDYLTKPYDFSILLARVEALLRRSQRVPERVTRGRLSMDVTANAATLDGRDLLLTQKEFSLLLVFTQNPGRFISGEYLYEKVWNQPQTSDSGALKTAITRLRTKIAGSGWRIESARGEGYCLEKE